MASARPSVLKRARETALMEKRQAKEARKAEQRAEKEARRAAGLPDDDIVEMVRE
jgi:hypothetical protein